MKPPIYLFILTKYKRREYGWWIFTLSRNSKHESARWI